ncbi:MAG: hypothetical protein ABFE07_19670 [Armatimonadia bacterium]
MKRTVCLVAMLIALATALWAADPSVRIGVEPVWQARELPLSLAMGQGLELSVPAIPAKEGFLRVLRMQARLDTPTPNSGWNTFLALDINGQKVSPSLGGLRNSPSRNLNRDVQWKVPGMENEELIMRDSKLNVVFAPDFKQFDQRLAHEGEEAFWSVMDVSDLLSGDRENKLHLANVALPVWFGGKNLPIVLGDVTVGYLPVSYRSAANQARTRPLPKGKRVQGEGYSLLMTPTGALAVQMGSEYYVLETSLTWPDGNLNHLACPDRDLGGKPQEWRILKADLTAQGGLVVAEGKYYRLTRTLKLDGPRVRVSEKIENLTPADLGLQFSYDVSTGGPLPVLYIGGDGDPGNNYADSIDMNPTVFSGQEKTGLGWLAEDDLLRAQARVRHAQGQTSVLSINFGLPPKAAYTMEWTLYPRSNNDYWDFINQVRRDWHVNFPIAGPFAFFGHVSSVARESVESIRGRTKDRHVQLACMHPWTNYQYPYSREDHKRWWQEASAKIHAVDPAIRTLVMMEPPLESRVHMDTWDQDPYRDSIVLNADGKPAYDLNYSPAYVGKDDFAAGYRLVWRYPMVPADDVAKADVTVSPLARQNPPLASIVAGGLDFRPVPIVTNSWMKYLDYDVDFAMKDCGANGMYIDCFSYGGSRSWARYTYDRWDGHTVDLDARTHRITRKYADLSLLSAAAQERIVRRIQAAGGVVVANSEPCTRNMRQVRLNRFVETGGGARYDCGTHLYTPIALGMPMGQMPQDQRNARGFIADVVENLKYGCVYYYYSIPLGYDYGCVNRMFPFTPRELHSGWLVGEERIITSKPGQYGWGDMSQATAWHYDAEGKESRLNLTPRRVGKGNVWDVPLERGEIVILERQKLP